MEYYSVSLLKIGLLGSSAKMIFDRLNRVRKYCINRNSGLCFILLNVRNGARSGTVIPSISAVYVFDREVLEAMLKDEQQRIQKDLEKFADKLKSYGVSLFPLCLNIFEKIGRSFLISSQYYVYFVILLY